MGRPARLTETWWRNFTHPSMVLWRLQPGSARKLRLFACACGRHVWHLLEDERSRQAIEAAEAWADGLLSAGELRQRRLAAEAAEQDVRRRRRSYKFTFAARVAILAAWRSKELVPQAAYNVLWVDGAATPHLCDLLRDIFNPCRRTPIDPAWLTWNDGTVKKIAQAIYDERRFADLPILADALEDAGCAHAEILAHCRGSRPHVRGCWVVDLLLGKT
jgi:hypothetical protein